jgi:transcription elongation GreA/GreB family factor
MDKLDLVEQIRAQLRRTVSVAESESQAAAEEARFGADANEKRQDARVAIEYSNMARAQGRRVKIAMAELESLEGFAPRRLAGRARVDVGAIVEVEDEDTGEGRTLFLAPAGAGITVTGPGGDGLLYVVTPASPLGKAVIGHVAGEVVDCTVRGEPREWLISYVG